MAATTALDYSTPAIARLGRSRAVGVAGATIAAVAVWAVAVPLLGMQLLVRFGAGAPQAVGIDYVVGATLVASLMAWGLLAMLERRTSHARAVWTSVAVVVLLASLSLPLTAGTSASTKATLALMHVVAAAVLVPALRRSSTVQSLGIAERDHLT